MGYIDLIEKKVQYGEEDGEELKREIRHNNNKRNDNYSIAAKTAEDKTSQLGNIEETDKEREREREREREEYQERHGDDEKIALKNEQSTMRV